ncbi:hypothetical protein IJ765_02920 [Candidatus Saccharibacteria bacterium]|nr:hypothetical protein [Candidatus Saccharibacteria bacterium]
MIDVHSHILYGIDDGSKSISESADILDGLKEQGFTDIILTPHYVADTTYVSPRKNNLKLMRSLQKAAPEGIKLHLGNEIYVDRNIDELLSQKVISSLADSKYLLIELPMSGEFEGYEDIFDSLRLKGYQVVLAHPERYSSTHHDYSIIEKLHESGVLFQCNYGSFIGQYGHKSQKLAKKLAKNKLIFMLGTDIHHARDYSEIAKSLKKLRRYYTAEELEDLTTNHPRKIIEKH